MSYQEAFNVKTRAFLLEILEPLCLFLEETHEIEISREEVIKFLGLPKNKAPSSAAPGYQTPSGTRGRAKAEPRPQCIFVTKNGSQCSKNASLDRTMCTTHIKAEAKKIADVKKKAETVFFNPPREESLKTEIFDLKNNLVWEQVRGFVFRDAEPKQIVGIFDKKKKQFRDLTTEEEEIASRMGLEIEGYDESFADLQPPTVKSRPSTKAPVKRGKPKKEEEAPKVKAAKKVEVSEEEEEDTPSPPIIIPRPQKAKKVVESTEEAPKPSRPVKAKKAESSSEEEQEAPVKNSTDSDEEETPPIEEEQEAPVKKSRPALPSVEEAPKALKSKMPTSSLSSKKDSPIEEKTIKAVPTTTVSRPRLPVGRPAVPRPTFTQISHQEESEEEVSE